MDGLFGSLTRLEFISVHGAETDPNSVFPSITNCCPSAVLGNNLSFLHCLAAASKSLFDPVTCGEDDRTAIRPAWQEFSQTFDLPIWVDGAWLCLHGRPAGRSALRAQPSEDPSGGPRGCWPPAGAAQIVLSSLRREAE